MSVLLAVSLSVILTVGHVAVRFFDWVKNYHYVYMLQFGAFFTSFSVAERFLSGKDAHFTLGCIGFLLSVFNLFLMFSKWRN
ncbi:hypothetical protein [Pseudoalteromonas viridis]|uniref:Uncharacterized protein n=1 Tax=Pseudoalteromonas viridis TaxID=339617 RepID=A0ABX7V2N4_9GAMM|nr:hypothetical protein [Pseudoalteromonas viridis]QTL33992.1 hypothetical protein J5X90_10415 [Pseudoalteromonas viridis]